MFERIWWSQNADYYWYTYNKPKGLGGQFLDLFSTEATRSHDSFSAQSYPEKARSACKAVGGCCTYDCGRCSRERMSGGTMHCTTACGCCMARRGLTFKDLKHDEMPTNQEAAKVSHSLTSLELVQRVLLVNVVPDIALEHSPPIYSCNDHGRRWC